MCIHKFTGLLLGFPRIMEFPLLTFSSRHLSNTLKLTPYSCEHKLCVHKFIGLLGLLRNMEILLLTFSFRHLSKLTPYSSEHNLCVHTYKFIGMLSWNSWAIWNSHYWLFHSDICRRHCAKMSQLYYWQ